MDNSINSASQLEKALSLMNVDSDTHQHQIEDRQPQPYQSYQPYQTESSSKQQVKQIPQKNKTGAQANSTSGLLVNLNGLHNITNTKMDTLNDNILRLTNKIDQLAVNQEKQLEVLASISRNLLALQTSQQPTSSSLPAKEKSQSISIKEFGFKNCIDLMSTLIIALLSLCKRELMKKGKNYLSSRDISVTILSRAISVVTKNKVKIHREIHEPITLPKNTSPTAIQVATKIGTVHNIAPMITPETFFELMNNPECNTFITLMRDVIDGLKVIRYLIPYYEADILCAIEFPYVDKEGNIIYDIKMLNSRSETSDETKIQNAAIKKQEELGVKLAAGCTLRGAMAIVFREK